MSIYDLKEQLQNDNNSIPMKFFKLEQTSEALLIIWLKELKNFKRALIQYQINDGNRLPIFFPPQAAVPSTI